MSFQKWTSVILSRFCDNICDWLAYVKARLHIRVPKRVPALLARDGHQWQGTPTDNYGEQRTRGSTTHANNTKTDPDISCADTNDADTRRHRQTDANTDTDPEPTCGSALTDAGSTRMHECTYAHTDTYGDTGADAMHNANTRWRHTHTSGCVPSLGVCSNRTPP